jgi:hypothetical protein
MSLQIPNVEKPLPMKGRLGQAKSPKVKDGSSPKNPKSSNTTAVNAATLAIAQQSTVVQSADHAHLSDTGKNLSNSNAESTGFNHEIHELSQHVYSEASNNKMIQSYTWDKPLHSYPTTNHIVPVQLDKLPLGTFH